MVKDFLRKPHLAVAATASVCILLFSPSSDLPEEIPVWVNDKVAHATVFAGLAFLWMQYARKAIRVTWMLGAFAFLTEVVQYLLPASFFRSFDGKDMVADGIGILLGLLASRLFDRFTR